MTAFEIVIAVLITPVSAILIGFWVLHESRKISAKARQREQRSRHHA